MFPGRTYTRFLIREFLKVFIVCIIFIVGLSFIVRTLQKLDSAKTFTFMQIVIMRFLEAPEIISREALLASSMFASVYTMSRLTKNREILALRSCGVSSYRIISPLILLGLLICGLSLLFEDYVVVRSFFMRDRFYAGIKGEEIKTYLKDRRDLIIYGEGNIVYKIGRFVIKSREMNDVMIIKRDNLGNIVYRIDAIKARWNGDEWEFYDGIKRTFTNDGEIKQQEIFSVLETGIRDDPRYFGRETRKIENMTLSEGYSYVKMIRKMGLEYRALLTKYNRKIANALTLFLVILIGLSLGSMTFKNALVISFSMTLGIVLAFFFIIEIGYTFGSSGKLSPVVGGWLGNIVFSVLGIYLIRKIRV